MSHFKRHKPKRHVTCQMCQWHKMLGNNPQHRKPTDLRRIAAAEATRAAYA